MKKITMIIALTGLIFSISACNHQSGKAGNSKEIKKPKGRFFCTMDTDVTSDKPGICSKCGMDLVERDTTGNK